MYCTDEAHPPVTRLHQVVYTANYFNFPCDQIQQYETDVLGDKGEDPMLVIEALEQTGKKEPQPTEVTFVSFKWYMGSK